MLKTAGFQGGFMLLQVVMYVVGKAAKEDKIPVILPNNDKDGNDGNALFNAVTVIRDQAS